METKIEVIDIKAELEVFDPIAKAIAEARSTINNLPNLKTNKA